MPFDNERRSKRNERPKTEKRGMIFTKGMSMHIAVVSVLTRRQEARMNEIGIALLFERG